MPGDKTMGWVRQTQQFGLSLLFSITSHIPSAYPGLRQIYKIVLYMCFNMLVEGSEFIKNSSLNTSSSAAFNHNVFYTH